jgi:5-methyltetrahydrofolate--homocysteine methyltransferase
MRGDAAIMAADVLMGHDPNCMRWIRKFREAARQPGDGAGAAAADRGRARGARRRPMSERRTR